jgi:acid phosphatase
MPSSRCLTPSRYRLAALPLTLSLMASLPACTNNSPDPAVTAAAVTAATTKSLQDKVQNIVVIYAENRSFDNLFGRFPGANGINTVLDANGNPTAAYIPQKNRDGSVLATLPQTWGGVTAAGQPNTVTQAQSANLPNAPFAIETAFTAASGATLTPATVTRDLYHRFFENQMEINGGKNDMFAAWADAGGLTMGHFDTANGTALYKLAQQYVLADNFFEGAFGGSFLNHQYLICACAPTYPNADTASQKPTISVVNKNADGSYSTMLTTASASPASALDGPPKYVLSGNIAPKDYFGAGDGFRAINTMQAPYQPSGNAPVDTTGNDSLYADPSKATTLPAQTQTNIGDLLTAQGVSWKWYSGSWNAAVADGEQDPSASRTVIYKADSNGVSSTANVDFQPHHQPFNYYASMDPVTNAAARAAHLKDYTDLIDDAAGGTLPAVSFYKPEGVYNQHEGYANITDGDNRIASLVSKLQASPQWAHMVIIVTYDEFGGVWDHVAPPKGDLLGPGTRIPAIIISPIAKAGTVDHTQYDTASVLRLITRRFGLSALPGLKLRDDSLTAAGGQPMGDLTNALAL